MKKGVIQRTVITIGFGELGADARTAPGMVVHSPSAALSTVRVLAISTQAETSSSSLHAAHLMQSMCADMFDGKPARRLWMIVEGAPTFNRHISKVERHHKL
jgi:hypothetical protein